MSTYTQIIYHIIFATKNRRPTLLAANHERLFRHIWGIIKNKNSYLYRINGVEDHIHMLIDLHPSIALADLVKNIKVSTSKMIKLEQFFPDFDAWQEGYGAFTHVIEDKERLIRYINNQKQHHKKWSFVEEYRKLLQQYGITVDERYWV